MKGFLKWIGKVLGGLGIDFALFVALAVIINDSNNYTGVLGLITLVTFVGAFFFPWFLLKKDNMPKLLRFVDTMTVIGSLSFLWITLFLTNGSPNSFLNTLLFFTTFGIPFFSHLFTKRKITIESMPVKQENKENKSDKKEEKADSILTDEITEDYQLYLDILEDGSAVEKKVEEILRMLLKIEKLHPNLSQEQAHEVERLFTKDLKDLLKIYTELDHEEREETKVEVLNHLKVMKQYLDSVLDHTRQEKLHKMNVSMKLIQERYRK